MKQNTKDSALSANLIQYPVKQLIKSICSTAYLKNIPFAIWKLPEKKALHIILHLSKETNTKQLDLEHLPKGFLASPFLNKDQEQSLYLKADILFTIGEAEVQVEINNNDILVRERAEEILSQLVRSLKSNESGKSVYFTNPAFAPSVSDKIAFKNLVEQAVEEILKGSFEKVVVSRNKHVGLRGDFDVASSFLYACEIYKNAFVSLVSVPGHGTWMGATPETLIKVDENKMFYTDSLAGTQSLGDKLPSEISWTQKEIEEQALVSRYIINCFKKIRLREFKEIGPRTVTAGNLLHLRTQFIVDMNATGFPDLATTMLKLLHPTSAVCGMPLEPAMKFVIENEKYDRSFYSGYLGPVNIEEETHLYVNLRCMQLLSEKAVLYAGAGILSNSDPEKEWQETEVKCETLMKVLEGAMSY